MFWHNFHFHTKVAILWELPPVFVFWFHMQTYNLLSERWFTHASPTLFNAGTPRPQLSRSAVHLPLDQVYSRCIWNLWVLLLNWNGVLWHKAFAGVVSSVDSIKYGVVRVNWTETAFFVTSEHHQFLGVKWHHFCLLLFLHSIYKICYLSTRTSIIRLYRCARQNAQASKTCAMHRLTMQTMVIK